MRHHEPADIKHKNTQMIIEAYQDTEQVRDEWLDLQARAAGDPHDTLDWIRLWRAKHPKRHMADPWIVLCRDNGGRGVAVLPLAVRNHMGCSVLQWLGADQGNYSSGLFDPDFWKSKEAPDCTSFLRAILDALPQVDLVHLSHHPDELHGLANPLACVPSVVASSAGYAFPLSPDWEAHYAERFGSSSRRELRRCERRLADNGTLSVRAVTTHNDKQTALAAMVGQKREQLSELGVSDFLADDDMQAFYRTLVDLEDAPGGISVRLFTLSVDRDILAVNLGLAFQDRFYGLMSSTTSGPLRRFAPGNVLFRDVVKLLAEEGVTTFDCGAGENDHKLRWCTQKRICRHAVKPVSARGWAYAAVLASALIVKTRIRNSPAVWRLAQKARRARSKLVWALPAPEPRDASGATPRVQS